MTTQAYTPYQVWNRSTRWFHWINFICIILLAFLGLVMMYKSDLGISGLAAKIKLKELHVIIGYVFVTNLLVRFILGFFAHKHNGWRQLFFPKPRDKFKIKNYLSKQNVNEKDSYLGHNPLGRLSVIAIYFLLFVMAVTGLVRAGTDVYFPPFGYIVAQYVAKPGINPSQLKPYDKSQVSKQRFEKLNVFKSPFGKIHVYCFYCLMFFIALHIFAVILTEVRQGEGLISAMFTGKKYLSKEPVDE